MVVNKNSSKSTLPAIASKAREKWAAKKSGGQNGHKGHTLEPVANSNHIVVHKVGQCAVCGVTLDLIEEYMEDPDTQNPDWYGQPGCQKIMKLPFLF